MNLRTGLAAFALLPAATGVLAQERPPIRFDNWLYFQENTNDTGRWQYRPRLYIPFNLPRGWTFTQRIDLPVYYTDKVGTENPTGQWKAGIADWFVEEIFASPEVAANLKLSTSVRFVFPTGGGSPFGSQQYQIAPSVGAIYAIPDQRITINPLARYFMSVHATAPGAAQIRRLDLYPTITFGLADSWSFSFYNENSIIYNQETRKWFVPIDVLFIKRISQSVEFAFGGAYGLVKDDPQYNYVINGRLTFYF